MAAPTPEPEWRPVLRYPGYSVSNTGLIRNDKSRRILHQYNTDGYLVLKPMDRAANKGRTERVHRLVAEAFCPNPDCKPFVDHIDCNPLNNNASNLRWCNAEESARNKKRNKRNTSGRTGVYFNKPSGKWMAYCRIDGKMTYLGIYDDKDEASFVRDSIAANVYGEFFHDDRPPVEV